MEFYCNGKFVGIELDKLSDEDFLIFEKEFKAAKERRGKSYVPKGFGLKKVEALHDFVSRATHRGIEENLHSVEYKKIEQMLFRICDLKTGNYEIKKFGNVERIVSKTNVPKAQSQVYGLIFDSIVDSITKNIPISKATIEEEK